MGKYVTRHIQSTLLLLPLAQDSNRRWYRYIFDNLYTYIYTVTHWNSWNNVYDVWQIELLEYVFNCLYRLVFAIHYSMAYDNEATKLPSNDGVLRMKIDTLGLNGWTCKQQSARMVCVVRRAVMYWCNVYSRMFDSIRDFRPHEVNSWILFLFWLSWADTYICSRRKLMAKFVNNLQKNFCRGQNLNSEEQPHNKYVLVKGWLKMYMKACVFREEQRNSSFMCRA